MADTVVEIDEKKLLAKPGQTIIQVADEAGIYIPRFCYHPHLSAPANCRMCLVEIEKMPKVLPACATPVAPGMKVWTRSAKTLAAQKAVMEFLLINHPLDCPICDQGGECELQDLAMGHGSSHSRYREGKRSVADQNLGPLVATEMTRCIYCTRCVRFGQEVAGVRELGGIGRGEFTAISTYVKHALQSEVSGNIIDLCPVGALTDKTYRFTARPWELDQAPSVSAHDCLGSNLHVHSRYGKVMRVVSRENKAINETWIADRDRYSYTGLYHSDRLEEPVARIDGRWQVVDWQQAMEFAANKITETITLHGADRFGALASPNSTLEEFYLLQKIMRGLGSPHVDHRLREIDTQDQDAMPLFPGLGFGLADLETRGACLLIGSNLQREQPIAALRLRKAALKGTNVCVVNPMDYVFNFPVHAKTIVSPLQLPSSLAAIAKALGHPQAEEWGALTISEDERQIADTLREKPNACVLLGALAWHHPQASRIRFFAQHIANLTGARLGSMTAGANTAGGWLAGAVPHRHVGGGGLNHAGLSAYDMLAKPRKGYLFLNVEPDLDCANACHAIEACKQASLIVALTPYRNPIIEAHADVVLPIAPFTETQGTFINASGEWQTFGPAALSFGASRPAWKALRVLANFLHLAGFDYETADDIAQEIKTEIAKKPLSGHPVASFQLTDVSLPKHDMHLARIGEVPLYALDSLLRRARPLQEAQALLEGEIACARLHPETAKRYGVQAGEHVLLKQHVENVALPVIIDTRVARDAVWVAGGIPETKGLGDLFGTIELGKVHV